MIGGHRQMKVIGILVLGFLALQMMVNINQGIAYERPTPNFKLVLLAPTNMPTRVLAAQVITRELWKIGIDAELLLLGWDGFYPRSRSTKPDAEGGKDICMIGLGAGIGAHHSRWCTIKDSTMENWIPPTSQELDSLIEELELQPDRERRQELVCAILSITMWERPFLTGLYHGADVIAADAALRGILGTLEETYFEDDKQTTYIQAITTRFTDLNIALAPDSAYNGRFMSPPFSGLYTWDLDGIIRPRLAAADPIPIGTHDVIAELIDPATIATDSPYKDKATWGPNPNIDTFKYNATVIAANYSMFLIPLRKGMPWQPGYGYTADMRLNITVDDLLWTMAYYWNEEVPSDTVVQVIKGRWGSDYTRAFEKINATLVKVNIRGLGGNGLAAKWFDELAEIPWILPRHILDPTFNATPYGGHVGVTPDGTTILPYAEQKRYRYNTGQGNRPLVGTGPYYLERWDEATQSAIDKKFANWGGYDDNTLWYDTRFQQNNIETYVLSVYSTKHQALLELENEKIDFVSGFDLQNDVPYLRNHPKIQLEKVIGYGCQYLVYNPFHPKLSNRYVRLAISHLAPRQRIVSYILSGFGVANAAGIWIHDPDYPPEEKWATIGLNESQNVWLDSKTELKFQGHINYSLEKAWALMEKADYNMDPFREAVGLEAEGIRPSSDIKPIPLILAFGGVITVLGAALILSQRYWQRYLAGEPVMLRLSRQRKQIMDAMALKESPRLAKKAEAQKLFQQVVNDKVLSPNLTIYAMLNLCDLMLGEVRAYGAEIVFQEADKLATRIADIASEQDSPSLRVEALLLQSKFALLKGMIREADQLLGQASKLAESRRLPKLVAKVAQEESAFEAEISRWEELAARAAPLRERLEQSRLQDYIAQAVKVFDLEEAAT